MTTNQLAGIIMLVVFAIGVIVVVRSAVGSWKETHKIILWSVFVTVWVGIGAFLISGGK